MPLLGARTLTNEAAWLLVMGQGPNNWRWGKAEKRVVGCVARRPPARPPALPQYSERCAARGPLADVDVRVGAVIAVPMPAL